MSCKVNLNVHIDEYHEQQVVILDQTGSSPLAVLLELEEGGGGREITVFTKIAHCTCHDRQISKR